MQPAIAIDHYYKEAVRLFFYIYNSQGLNIIVIIIIINLKLF